MELIGLIVVGVVVLPILAVLALTLALPIFWVWMLADSILRETWEYPSNNQNEKLLWIVLMIVFQVSAIAYYFLVFRELKRGEAVSRAYAPVSSPPPAAPTPPVSA